MNGNVFNRTAASEARLQEIKDVTPDIAKQIRSVWKSCLTRGAARRRIDKLLRTCGVEQLGEHKRSGNIVFYCNAGDTYAATVVTIGDHLSVQCIGDFLERDLVKEFEQL